MRSSFEETVESVTKIDDTRHLCMDLSWRLGWSSQERMIGLLATGVMVPTTSFGAGVDAPGVRLVIIYTAIQDGIVGYAQQTLLNKSP